MTPFRGSPGFTEEWGNFSFEISDGIGTITLDRPEKLNALTFDVYADLRDLFDELPHRDDVRVVVLTGQGKGFCSGGDVDDIIGQLLEMNTEGLLDFTRMTGTTVQRMRECPIPIIAAVNGVAAGAGAVLALAADLRIFARSASLAFLFTRVGLAGADMGSAYLLPRVVGLGRASELLLLGDSVSSERALEMGLALQVVEDAELSSATEQLARRLAEGPALAQATTKMLLSREIDMDMAGSLELEAMAQALLMTSGDFAEFYDAFKGKRRPNWGSR
jgi:enoyl-CoA hydratase/carnithine racemase